MGRMLGREVEDWAAGLVGEGRSGGGAVSYLVLEGRFGCGVWGTLADAKRRGARRCSVEIHPRGQGFKWTKGVGDTRPHRLQERDAGDGPEGPPVEGRPGRRGPGAPVGGSPRGAVSRGLRTRRERRGWPAPRGSGGRASARGCHGDGLAGGGGYTEKRSALSLAAAPGSPRQRWVRSCRPGAGPGHGVLRPEPLGLRAGLGAARRRPALTAAPCPAPGERRPRASCGALSGCSSRSTTFCCP